MTRIPIKFLLSQKKILSFIALLAGLKNVYHPLGVWPISFFGLSASLVWIKGGNKTVSLLLRFRDEGAKFIALIWIPFFWPRPSIEVEYPLLFFFWWRWWVTVWINPVFMSLVASVLQQQLKQEQLCCVCIFEFCEMINNNFNVMLLIERLIMVYFRGFNERGI